MSHEETIYGLIPEHKAPPEKAPMYRSKYAGTIPPTGSTFGPAVTSQIPVSNMAGDFDEPRRAHPHRAMGATMGKNTSNSVDPTTYLKRSTRDLPRNEKFEYKDRMKPSLDTKPLRTREVPKKTKNFITENALAAIMAESKRATKNDIDYMHKPEYGKVPAYLEDVKHQVTKEKEYIRTMMQRERDDHSHQPKLVLLPEEERLRLVEDLKRKWDEVNKKYQLISHNVVLDTIGKVKRKEQCEAELSQLEKAIERMSKRNIYIQEEDGLDV